MVGIAFGRDESSQELGDILIAKQVIPYELRRVGAKVVPRAAHPEAGPTLLNRARNLLWVRQRSDGSTRKPIFGALLSGEKLVDDEKVNTTARVNTVMRITRRVPEGPRALGGCEPRW